MEPEFLIKLDRLLWAFNHFRVDPSSPKSSEEVHLNSLLDSSLQERAVEVTHRIGDRLVRTALLVHGLCREENGAWVVLGHSILAEASVELQVSRIASVQWREDGDELS